MPVIDLNADLGESFGRWTLGEDAALIEVISSANIACGFHAGDPSTLRRSCELAVGAGVAIGAQVAYRDLAGFGRRFIDASFTELRDDVLYQLGALDGFARIAGSRVSYLKPHGALYHAVVHHQEQAKAVVDAVRTYDPTLAVLGLPGSLLLQEASAVGLRVVNEAFADRQYTADGGLLARSEPGAVLTEPARIAEQVRRLLAGEGVIADDGSVVALNAESICVHGDTPGAVGIARAVRQRISASGGRVQSFTDRPA
ncbi:LamB/YcsF family protein [Kineosporia babensis]|uniref:5-oxoprolinase subunit A n=1 Tax=Kineosporia babensis TaxID=499548 RepID=A0A9X1N9S5_9ACTN|nr:LamB/YcsF family protein [Kineosporia babensis]